MKAIQVRARESATANVYQRPQDWRCASCGQLLGRLCDGRLHLRFGRGYEYVVSLPVTSACRGCQTLNELSQVKPARIAAVSQAATAP
jgi:hypothetical protein